MTTCTTTLTVSNVVYSGGKTLIVNTEFGPISVCGTMDVFYADARPMWGVFSGLLHLNEITIPATVHFKGNEGTLDIEVPKFSWKCLIGSYAVGALDGENIVLERIPGAPWPGGGPGLLVGHRQGEIIIALCD